MKTTHTQMQLQMQNSLERNMKLARTSARMTLVALAVLASPLAMAQNSTQDILGWYGGLSAGQSRAVIDDAKITSGLLGSGLTTTSIDDKNRDTGYKVFGGYQFNPNFSLEGGYFDLGKFGFTSTTTPAGTLRGEIKLRGLNLDAVGKLPFTEKLSGIGRVGLTYNDAQGSFGSTGAVPVPDPSPSKRDTNYKFGLGLQYDFTPTLAMRLEAERYRVNDAVGSRGDIDLVSVGLILRFGKKEQERVVYAPAPAPEPAPVAKAAEPTPVAVVAAAPIVVAPVPKVLHRVTISVDSDFDFDKSSLNAGGKKVADKFLVDLKGMNYTHIAVTGNADRIGTKDYNMKLSKRRADVVQNYLVAAGGIAASKIVATGVGESQPETGLHDCDKAKSNKALISCLQPDRRVDIEVHGFQ
jgi:OmpA-OmpF porin, OOP family